MPNLVFLSFIGIAASIHHQIQQWQVLNKTEADNKIYT